MSEARTVVTDPALGFSYRVVLDKEGRREIVFQTHMPANCTAAQLDEALNKVAQAADKQVAFYEMLEAQRFKAEHEEKLHSLNAQLAGLDEMSKAAWDMSGKKGQWTPDRLSPKEQQARSNIEVSLERYREGYTKYARIEAECLAILSGYVSDGSTNSHSRVPDR